MGKPVVALLSPLHNAYSETFIQAHKKRLRGEVKFFFDGWVPGQLEGGGPVSSFRDLNYLARRVRHQASGAWRGRGDQSPANWRLEELKLAFKRSGVQVALAEYGPTAAECLQACRDLGIPLVVHFHGFDASEKQVLEKYAEGYREVFAYASYVVGVSRMMMQVLSDLGAPPEKLVYNPYGPDESFYSIHPDIDQKKFFSLGRFVDKKAPHLTLLAFKNLREVHPDASLYFGGDGPLLDVCRDLVTAWDLTGNVFFLGPLGPEAVRKHMADSLAYVQHSVTAVNGDSEGAPIAIMEAGAAGLPVISTRHAGIPDIILDGETGLLVEERDVTGMTRQMIRLAGDFNLARQLGEAARERIKLNFNINRHIQLLNDIIGKSMH